MKQAVVLFSSKTKSSLWLMTMMTAAHVALPTPSRNPFPPPSPPVTVPFSSDMFPSLHHSSPHQDKRSTIILRWGRKEVRFSHTNFYLFIFLKKKKYSKIYLPKQHFCLYSLLLKYALQLVLNIKSKTRFKSEKIISNRPGFWFLVFYWKIKSSMSLLGWIYTTNKSRSSVHPYIIFYHIAWIEGKKI